MLQDSTHVEGNTAWSTDSRLMVALAERLLRVRLHYWPLAAPGERVRLRATNAMVDEVLRRTRIVPKVLSVDDGYSSAANLKAIKDRGIKVISINGSKGRALIARADWDSDEYAEARDMRSAVESLMFTLKQGFDFGEVARRGLAAVHGELLEKALAYNLCHMVRTRLARAESHRLCTFNIGDPRRGRLPGRR